MKKCNVSTLSSSDVTYIKNNMNHARNSIYPKLPQDANEIHNILSFIEIKTFKGENFLMVGDVFAIDLSELKLENDKLTEFSDYLVDNYVDEDSSFLPKIWAEMTSSAQRSTNACESFHSKYNSNFSSTHPHIYTFLDVLKAIQLVTYKRVTTFFREAIGVTFFKKKSRETIRGSDERQFVSAVIDMTPVVEFKSRSAVGVS
ncbi:hypothetical protein QTP88_016985 [Uroleucon formosanum]